MPLDGIAATVRPSLCPLTVNPLNPVRLLNFWKSRILEIQTTLFY
jgi:hypothetical protein